MKKTLFAMAAVAMMCAMAFSGCNSPETQPAVNNSVTNPVPPVITLYGSVQGVVVDVRNNPIEGALVWLSYPGAQTEPVETNAFGQYLLQRVPVAGELYWDGYQYQDATGGSGTPYLITVDALGFVTTYTAVLLDYASTIGVGQPVNAIQATAIPARMPTASAIVQGRVVNKLTSDLMQGVLCTLSLPYDYVPVAERIWADGNGHSVHAFPSNVDTSNENGVCEWLAVPEAIDSDEIYYTLTLSYPGFAAEPGQYMDVGVGYGNGHIYLLDSDPYDCDPMTPYDMVEVPDPVDDVAPFAVSTNIPVGGEIAYANRAMPLTIDFSEPMSDVDGAVSITATQFKSPGPVPIDWVILGNNLMISALNSTGLPAGMKLIITLDGLRDANEVAYKGINPCGELDAFTRHSNVFVSGTNVVKGDVVVNGDPTLMQAKNVRQVLNGPDPVIGGAGGPANNIPQANNMNVLNPYGALPMCTSCGSNLGEVDTVSLKWDAATPVPPGPGGAVRKYEVYAELNTGGSVGGLPVLVTATPTSANPPTSAEATLTEINDGLKFGDATQWTAANVCSAGMCLNGMGPCSSAASCLLGIPLVTDENDGGLYYFDNGFGLNMSVIAINQNAQAGPFSNDASVRDNVPPTAADQGYGFDNEKYDWNCTPAVGDPGKGCPWSPLNTVSDTNYAIFPLTSGWGNTYNADLQTLVEMTGGSGSITYNTSDILAWVGDANIIKSRANEDLDGTQALIGKLSLDSASTAMITGASFEEVTDKKRTMAVAIEGLQFLAQGDKLLYSGLTGGLLDERGNAANDAYAGMIFADRVVPLVVAATASDMLLSDNQKLEVTFHEPVNAEDAEDAANYSFTGVSASDAATLAGQTVTIESDTAFQYSSLYEAYDCPAGSGGLDIGGTNALTSTVTDLVGNVCGLVTGTFTQVMFLVSDNIAPRLLGGLAGGVPINTAGSTWMVDDVCSDPANCNIVAYLSTSEPVVRDMDCNGVLDAADQTASGVSAAVSSPTYLGAGNLDPAASTHPAFLVVQANGTTVANGNWIQLTAQDNSGNGMSFLADTLTLTGGAGGGSYID